VNNENILCENVKCSTLYKGSALFAEAELDVGLRVSFDNMSDWKWIWEEAGEQLIVRRLM
jgi:hypothetical protein